jgi:hypothetical protein
MSVHLFEGSIAGTPPEPWLLEAVTLRLIYDSERERFDEELATKHYLKNARVVGRVLRYVAEYRGQWVALLVFSSPALHLKLRDQWLHWSPRQVKERRHLIAQNSRFLVLAAACQWPNLASRVLKLACERLPQDWQEQFGYPVQIVETFVDPQRFRATCYKVAGWQRLGPTQGFARDWLDFYTDTQHPKELWVRPLAEGSLEQVRAAELPPAWANRQDPPPPACLVPTGRLNSLCECFGKQMTDPRHPRGVRHRLAGFLTLIALAVAANCQTPHAIAQFADSLNHGQRRRLRCRPRPGKPREYDVPSERTFRRLLKKVNPEQLKDVLVKWMAADDPAPLKVVHADGKVVKNAQPAPPRSPAQQAEAASQPPCEIPPELQKPKADKALTLVNFHTDDQRLVDQVAVPADTNEEAATAAHLPKMDLAGVCLTADAAHLTKANCRQLTQNNGADFFIFLKGNQPLALAKAKQLLPGPVPPQAQTVEKHHGRVETRQLWVAPTDPKTMGLAGVAQVVRIRYHSQEVRKGKVISESEDVRFAVTSYGPEEADPDALLALGRSHWSIENGQFYRRDRTQDEDRCPVRDTIAARNLSLFRSLAIYLFKRQSKSKDGKKSLPDFHRHVHRKPWGILRRLTQRRAEE